MEDSGSCQSDTLVKKPNTISVVWNYFGLKADSEGRPIVKECGSPVCKVCGKVVPAKGGNTSNLITHLRDHHPDKYSEAWPKVAKKACSTKGKFVQPTLHELQERSMKYPSQSNITKELNSAVTFYLATDMQPISSVERPGFRHLISKLNPRYQLPSRKHFTDYEIQKLYNHVRESVVCPKLNNCSYFAFTTGFWTSPATIPYLTVTVHFIDSTWNLNSFCLNTSPMYEDHTGENIASALNDVLNNWELSAEYLVASTTDNGSNIVAAFRSLDWIRVSCFGHNLDLAVNKALDCARVKSALARCRRLVELFHRSWKKKCDLTEQQMSLDLPQHKLIIASVATRWGSTYSMVKRVIEQQQAICAVLATDRQNQMICSLF